MKDYQSEEKFYYFRNNKLYLFFKKYGITFVLLIKLWMVHAASMKTIRNKAGNKAEFTQNPPHSI